MGLRQRSCRRTRVRAGLGSLHNEVSCDPQAMDNDVCVVTGFPAPDQTSSEQVGPSSQSVGGINQELVPCGNILLQLSEAHETAVGHPVWVTAGVGASVT